MARTPTDRHRRFGARRSSVVGAAVVAAVVVVLFLAGVGISVGAQALRSASDASDQVVHLALPDEAPTVGTSALPVDTVEGPVRRGLTLTEARTVLSAAGFSVEVRGRHSLTDESGALVSAQDPEPGVLVESGSTVALVLETVEKTKSAKSAKKKRYVVCIDPGHQDRSDSSVEPLGPGSKSTKARAMGGATGTATGLAEHEIALQLSMNLKKRLQQRGIRVVMTRTTNDVNLSNAERGRKAKRAGADLFVRVHGNGSPDETVSGVSVAYPGRTRWTDRVSASSKRAGTLVLANVVRHTGAQDRGVRAVTDHAGFNWSGVPAILVECGFLSNPVEDRLLASPHYQDKVAEGLAVGIDEYLRGADR